MGKYSYRTDAQQLEFLTKRIERLSASLERLEAMGMTSVSSAGSTKSFRQQEEIRAELERAEKEYEIINARSNEDPINPIFKEMVVCNRKQY